MRKRIVALNRLFFNLQFTGMVKNPFQACHQILIKWLKFILLHKDSQMNSKDAVLHIQEVYNETLQCF